jgi:hypothetical protein
MMVDVTKTFWHESQISRLAPNQQVETHIKKLTLLYFLLDSWQPGNHLATFREAVSDAVTLSNGSDFADEML